MLRILLIIAVAIAVIIGLMKLTGDKQPAGEPAAGTTEESSDAAATEGTVGEAPDATGEATDEPGDEVTETPDETGEVMEEPADDAGEASGDTVDEGEEGLEETEEPPAEPNN
jgi:hypothetical protein